MYVYGVLVMLLVYCMCAVDVMYSMNGVFLQGGGGCFCAMTASLQLHRMKILLNQIASIIIHSNDIIQGVPFLVHVPTV